MAQEIKIIVEFFKKVFDNDFKLNGLSTEEGKIEHITYSTDIKDFFLYSLNKNTVWYNPFDGILYSYKPQEDSMFKKVFTNAWSFNYIFYPLFIENWGGCWKSYYFQVYE